YVEWANGDDSGISSLTLLSAITGVNFLDDGRHRWRPDIPHDPSDFGRCVRLLDSFPELRPQLSKVAEKHSRWAPHVERWAEFEALYRAAAASEHGNAPELFEALQEL